MLRHQPPGRVHHQPQAGRACEHIKHDGELVMPRDQPLSGNVIKSIAERRKQGRAHAQRVQLYIGMKQADGERSPSHRHKSSNRPLQGRLFSSPRNHVQQHPDRRGVLDGNRKRDRSFLHCKVIKIIGAGHAQRPNKRAQHQIAAADPEDTAAKTQQQEWRQHQNSKAGPRLGEYQGRDKGASGKKIAIENRFAEGGGGAPAERGGGNKEIAPPRMSLFCDGAQCDCTGGATLQASCPVAQDRNQS